MMERIKKIWSIICKILNAFFLVVLIGLIVILLYLAIGSKGNGLPFLQNYQMFTVLSGSMEPTLNVGGVIIVEKVDPMTLQEGDIITFISNDTSLSGQVVSHRIIQVVDNNNGWRSKVRLSLSQKVMRTRIVTMRPLCQRMSLAALSFISHIWAIF